MNVIRGARLSPDPFETIFDSIDNLKVSCPHQIRCAITHGHARPSCSFGDVVDPLKSLLDNARYDRPRRQPEEHRFSHSVQFYEGHSAFVDTLSEYVASGLRSGGSLVIVVTEAHRVGLTTRLRNIEIDFETAVLEDRCIVLDAERTLSEFMWEGWPDRTRLMSAVDPILRRAKASAERGCGSMFVCGEMVALLWAENNYEAALYLENLWSEIQRIYQFDLHCAYPMSCFSNAEHEARFGKVCQLHDRVVPAESYTSLDNDVERMRMISALQQKALAMNAVVDERDQEIARRKQAESRFRHSEQFTAQLLESSEDCLKVLDLDGHLEYMSSSGRKILEIDDVNQVLGRRWLDFWKEEDRPRISAALETARSGGVGNFQGDLPTRSGTPKSWHVRITPIIGVDGEVERLIAVSRDITDSERSHQVAVQAEKLAAAGRLAATIAHEINNPLEAVTNLIYLAKSSKGVPQEVCQQLEIADRELARVAQLAQQTLGFYRENTSCKWVSVPELVNDILLIYERKLKYKQIELTAAVVPQLEVYGKQGELKQALSNLVANAIEASKIGGRIWLRARPASRWADQRESGIRITVADNGSGMSPEVRERVFVPFFTTKPGIGTGIGLWVTKSLIEQHGGSVHFRSRQGSGTGMSFFIPNGETLPS